MLFVVAMRQKKIMLKLSETLWTSRVITIFLLLVHYTFLLSVLETVQSKSKGQSAADASSHHAVLLKFDFYPCCSYATVRIRVHKTFVDPSPVRVL